MSEALQKAAKRAAEMRESGEMEILNPLQKSAKNPDSRALALKAKCFECVGGTLDASPDNWRNEIRHCSSKTCPLMPWRSYK